MKAAEEAKTGSEARSGPWAVAQALAACLEGGEARPRTSAMNAEDRAELQSLLHIAHRLDARMEPVCPSTAFVRSLREELVQEAERRMARRERRRRIAVISAAVAGGIVSIASLVGGIVVLVRWLRTRTEAHQASTA